jgi:type II secretory pathway pseudopilin PulG
MRTRLITQRGLSLIEVTIMVMVMSVLSAVMSPVIGDYVNDARHVKAADDVQVLAATFSRFVFDAPGTESGEGTWRQFDLLVGAGLAPEVGEGGDATWAAAVDHQRVGLLEEHLITNAPGYRPASGDPAAFVARGWRGPYLGTVIGPDPWGHRYAPYLGTVIGPDPWGHRYAINVGGWSRRGADVVVLSAGPDGRIGTPITHSGAARGGDDVLAVIGSGGL